MSVAQLVNMNRYQSILISSGAATDKHKDMKMSKELKDMAEALAKEAKVTLRVDIFIFNKTP